MKQNSRDYPEFYNWLIQPFIKKPHRIQLLRRLNRLLTFVMPGVYGLVFCWLFAKQVSLEKMWPFVWIPATGFVLFSLVRHWINFPRPYEKWEFQPLLEKHSSGHSFPSRHVFSATIISMCLCQLSLSLGLCSLFLSIMLAFVRVLGGVHYPKDVLVAWGLGILWGGLFLVV